MKKNKMVIVILLSIIVVLYIGYRLFLYWNYDVNKEKKQIETWNQRVQKK